MIFQQQKTLVPREIYRKFTVNLNFFIRNDLNYRLRKFLWYKQTLLRINFIEFSSKPFALIASSVYYLCYEYYTVSNEETLNSLKNYIFFILLFSSKKRKERKKVQISYSKAITKHREIIFI